MVNYICGSLSEWFNRKILWIRENIIDYFKNKFYDFILKRMGIRSKYNMILLNITSVVETLIITKTSVAIGVNKHLLFLLYFLLFA
jgi:hypothetical protein